MPMETLWPSLHNTVLATSSQPSINHKKTFYFVSCEKVMFVFMISVSIHLKTPPRPTTHAHSYSIGES